MADHKVDDGLKKEIEAGKTLKDTPVPETGVNTHDATLAGQKQHPVFSIQCPVYHIFSTQCPVYHIFSIQCPVFRIQFTLFRIQYLESSHCEN